MIPIKLPNAAVYAAICFLFFLSGCDINGAIGLAYPEPPEHYCGYGDGDRAGYHIAYDPDIDHSAERPANGWPLLVFHHGLGGNWSQNPAGIVNAARNRDTQYKVITLNTRMSPMMGDTFLQNGELVFPDGMLGNYYNASRDVACAIRQFRANSETLNIDPDRIALGGWSLGAGVTIWNAAARLDKPALEAALLKNESERSERDNALITLDAQMQVARDHFSSNTHFNNNLDKVEGCANCYDDIDERPNAYIQWAGGLDVMPTASNCLAVDSEILETDNDGRVIVSAQNNWRAAMNSQLWDDVSQTHNWFANNLNEFNAAALSETLIAKTGAHKIPLAMNDAAWANKLSATHYGPLIPADTANNRLAGAQEIAAVFNQLYTVDLLSGGDTDESLVGLSGLSGDRVNPVSRAFYEALNPLHFARLSAQIDNIPMVFVGGIQDTTVAPCNTALAVNYIKAINEELGSGVIHGFLYGTDHSFGTQWASITDNGLTVFDLHWPAASTQSAMEQNADLAYAATLADAPMQSTSSQSAPTQAAIPGSSVLLLQGFENQNNHWSAINQASNEASKWVWQAFKLIQISNAGQLDAQGKRLGTYLYYNPQEAYLWSDYTLWARASNHDNDGIGVLFRYQDAGNFYKLELDKERNFTRLTKWVDGTEAILASSAQSYQIDANLDIRVQVIGNQILVTIDEQAVFEQGVIYDDAFSQGTVAAYSWASVGANFDFIRVDGLAEGQPLVSSEPSAIPAFSIVRNGSLHHHDFNQTFDIDFIQEDRTVTLRRRPLSSFIPVVWQWDFGDGHLVRQVAQPLPYEYTETIDNSVYTVKEISLDVEELTHQYKRGTFAVRLSAYDSEDLSQATVLDGDALNVRLALPVGKPYVVWDTFKIPGGIMLCHSENQVIIDHFEGFLEHRDDCPYELIENGWEISACGTFTDIFTGNRMDIDFTADNTPWGWFNTNNWHGHVSISPYIGGLNEATDRHYDYTGLWCGGQTPSATAHRLVLNRDIITVHYQNEAFLVSDQ